MGKTVSTVQKKLKEKLVAKEYTFLIIGPRNSGKTTLLYKLVYPDHKFPTLPTIGFNLESFYYKNLYLNMYDITFSETSIPYLQKTFSEMEAITPFHGIIFVLNSETVEKDDLEFLRNILNLEVSFTKPVVILANKQDLTTAISQENLENEIGFDQLRKREKWFLRGSSALQNEGIRDGLDWLIKESN